MDLYSRLKILFKVGAKQSLVLLCLGLTLSLACVSLHAMEDPKEEGTVPEQRTPPLLPDGSPSLEPRQSVSRHLHHSHQKPGAIPALLSTSLGLRLSGDGAVGGMRRPIALLLMQNKVAQGLIGCNCGLVITLSNPPLMEPVQAKFAQKGVVYKFYNIPNGGVPEIPDLIEMLAYMKFTRDVLHKKSVVHCDSGIGRTGTVIACYHVIVDGDSAEDAIAKTRMERGDQTSIDKGDQEGFVHFVADHREDIMRQVEERMARIPAELIVREQELREQQGNEQHEKEEK
jgi:atypical dual specificity phosphatase